MLPMRRKIEHIVEHECKVKSFVKGTFDEKRILVELDKICAKTSSNLTLKGLLFGVKDMSMVIQHDAVLYYPMSCLTDCKRVVFLSC